MKRAVLRRSVINDVGTFGHLTVDDATWTTCERLPTGDHPSIPAGLYRLSLGMYYGGDGPGGKLDYPAFTVLNVPGRSQIKLHICNFPHELLGCIAPGMTFMSNTGGIFGVANSRLAFAEFMKAMGPDQDAEMEILDPVTP